VFKRLGDHPVVIGFASDDSKIEIVVRGDQRSVATGPLTTPAKV
jgi:hypothetical protein